VKCNRVVQLAGSLLLCFNCVPIPVRLLQVCEGADCAIRALGVVDELCLPHHGKAADTLWQQPFNAAALLLPSLLDSCFTLLENFVTSSDRGAGSSSSSSSRSGVTNFGKDRVTVSRDELVRHLIPFRCYRLSHSRHHIQLFTLMVTTLLLVC
jgi:hypothetical protein